MARRGGAFLEIEGLDELRATLQLARKEAERLASDTVYGVAQRVEGRLFRRYQNMTGPFKTGRSGRSLRVRRKREQLGIVTAEVRGGGDAPYLLMLEFGTSRTKAQPAIVPVVEEIRPELTQIWRQEFGEALEKILKRRARARR